MVDYAADVKKYVPNVNEKAIAGLVKHFGIALKEGSDSSLVSVSDNGCGIPLHRLPELFKRFSKGEAGHNGLGLYLAKSIVEAHGGRIWVESKLGQGSTFFFTVPQPS